MEEKDRKEILECVRTMLKSQSYIKWPWYLITTITIVVSLLSAVWLISATKLDSNTFTAYIRNEERQYGTLLKEIEQSQRIVNALYAAHIEQSRKAKTRNMQQEEEE